MFMRQVKEYSSMRVRIHRQTRCFSDSVIEIESIKLDTVINDKSSCGSLRPTVFNIKYHRHSRKKLSYTPSMT